VTPVTFLSERKAYNENGWRGSPPGRRFTMSATYFYDTEVEWSERRRGKVRSPGLPDLQIAAPPEFQGDEGTWTPEHLFVGSVNICFMTTFLAIAELSKLPRATYLFEEPGSLDEVARLAVACFGGHAAAKKTTGSGVTNA
jgi:hypothetical protein